MNHRCSSIFVLITAALGCVVASGCGEQPPAPVAVPADFSSEPAVSALIGSKAATARAAPGDAASHRDLGLALAANDGATLAEESFRRALAVDPGDIESRYQLAQLLSARGDLHGQVAELQTLLETDPTFYAGTYALGCALLDRGDLDEAEAAFRTVQRKQGPTFMGELGLGLVALERDRPDEAIPLLRKAAQKYPADLFVRFQLGQAYLALGQDDLAQKLLAGIEGASGRPMLRSPGTKKLDEYAVNRLTQIKLANQHMRTGKHSKAVTILRKLYRQDESDTAAGNNLAASLIQLGEQEDAMAVLDRCIELDPDHYELWTTQAKGFLSIAERERQAGDAAKSRNLLQRSEAAIEQAAALAPRVGQVHLVRGQVSRALRRDVDSVAAYRQAIELGETGESTYIDMSGAVSRTGGLQALEELLREGIAQPGLRPRLRFELCGVLMKSGRGKEARAAQQELASLAGSSQPGAQLASQADQLLRSRGH